MAGGIETEVVRVRKRTVDRARRWGARQKDEAMFPNGITDVAAFTLLMEKGLEAMKEKEESQ